MMYPSDNEFLESIKEEIEYNIKRLRNHPSLVLWCGNNEILEGFHFWGWKEQLGVHADDAMRSYKKIFYEIIPETLKSLDPEKPYHPSSPSSSYSGIPALHSGDFHFWDIIKKPLPLSAYEENVGRFMSEFGFKSYPEIKTIRSYAHEPDFDIRSEVIEFHQGWDTGADLVERHVKEQFGVAESFTKFLYLSQSTQAQAIKTAIEAQRRLKPYCMGSLFWQLNDCWPCASWSAIDYFGRWKALMYELKHLFADVMISPAVRNNKLEVYVVSDIPVALKLRVLLRLMNFEGVVHFEKEVEFQTRKPGSEMIFSIPMEKLNITNLKDQVVFVAEVFDENRRLDRNLLYFVRPADLLLKAENPEIKISESGNKAMICLRSTVLLKNVYLENPDVEGFFSDNFFDLLPGESKPVIFQANDSNCNESCFTVQSLGSLINPPFRPDI